MTGAKSLYWPVAAGYVLASVSAYSMPVFVGAFMAAFEISATEIGIVVSAELLCIAVSAIVLSGRIGEINLRTVALAGCCLAIVGHGLSVVAGSFVAFVLVRAIAGLGEGMALAAANALGAAAKQPDRVFAGAQIAVSVFVVLTVGLLPLLIAESGYRAGILCIIGIYVLWLPAILSFPAGTEIDSTELSNNEANRFPNRRLGILTLVAFGLMAIADVAMWVFIEQIGVHIGVAPETAGLLLSIATGLGLLGAFMAGVLGDRFGRLLPMSCMLLLLAVANIGLGEATSYSSYVISLLPLNLAILFLTPYFLGTLASLDQHGSWTAASGVVLPLSFAIGPLLAGLIITEGSFAAVGWATGSCALAALTIMIYVLRANRAEFIRPIESPP